MCIRDRLLPEDVIVQQRRTALKENRKKRKRGGTNPVVAVAEANNPAPPEEADRQAVDEKLCSICMNALEKNSVKGANRVVALECMHTFHSDCIDKWLVDLDRDTCPVCKRVSAKKGYSVVTKVLQVTTQPL
eukprot:TRINITY_DN44198_c0_g1_i1.p1 TRINITY_DN44198_c0_g1~~TRINITY_DN44198_c0_g1_i1.p1  ORF type:complete len:132 (+),score=36.82 TRINITY_DN44198_c0_g1_i1:114-509(+)